MFEGVNHYEKHHSLPSKYTLTGLSYRRLYDGYSLEFNYIIKIYFFSKQNHYNISIV